VRILVVEDEPDLAGTLRKALEEEGFAVDAADEGETGLYKLTHTPYDAAILDLMLPRLDGWSLLQSARAAKVATPVLILTASEGVDDRVRGLNLGADDYLAKPFALAELVARLRAIIRRRYGQSSPTMTLGALTVDTAARTVHRNGAPVGLTAREYAIFELLAARRGTLVTRAVICDHIYDEDTDILSNVVDVHIASLRRKLGGDVIRTRRGEGFIVDA
jgi:two-component system OmpR family response regulator